MTGLFWYLLSFSNLNYQFQHKDLYWLMAGALLLALLFVFVLRWKKETVKRMGDERLVKALIKEYSGKRFFLKFIFLFIAFIVGVIAAMNPRQAAGGENTVRKGIDVAIALDVSKSMLATDYAPSRLEKAKQFLQKLLEKMPDDRIALILFAGRAYMQMPLTADNGAAKLFVSSAAPDAVPQQGTVISDALEMSARAFNPADKKFKSVILISDGEDHDANAISVAGELSKQGVMINTVGIGSPEGATIPDTITGENKKDEAGNVVISKLNEAGLKEIASATNGVYLHLEESDKAVAQVMSQLSQIDRKAYADSSQISYRNWYWLFAAVMLLLLVIEFFFPEKKNLRLDHLFTGNLKKGFIILFICLPGMLFSQQDKSAEGKIFAGNELYRQGQYPEAEKKFREALTAAPESFVAKYNLAAALYKQDKKEDALKLLSDAATNAADKQLASKAWYNKGAILSRQKELEASVEAYKNALRNNPADKEARENLQKALLELKKKKNEEKKNDNQQKKKQQQKQQPKMKPKEAEQRLRLLQQKEKEVQKRIQKKREEGGGSQGKDW